MSANTRHSPVEVLRAPETRAREVQVVDFQLDEATETLVGASAAARPTRPFCLPPSPPLTNPHLKRAIPLPLLDANDCKARSCDSRSTRKADHMESARANHLDRKVSQGANGASTLLSPPYSPQRRTLALLTVDESEEEFCTSGAPLDSALFSPDTDEHSWEDFDASDVSEPPSMSLKDIDLGEESDDWDEPLFLNAPSVSDSSDGLDLNLFGGFHPHDEGLSRLRLDPTSSPSTGLLSLPGLDEPYEKSEPLFDPSDFDVFENGWDTAVSDSTHSSPRSSRISSEDTAFSHSHQDQHVLDGFAPGKPVIPVSPESPSRRNFVNLPGDEAPRNSSIDSLNALAPIVAPNAEDLRDGQAIHQMPSPKHTFSSPPFHQPADIPSEAFQSPFNVPLLFESPVMRSPPFRSLLFAPPEPQDIPLPESPENQVMDLPDADFKVPLHLLEESRLRALQQEMCATEVHARNREAMLTEYITRLNAMRPPPPLPVHVPVYYSRPQPVIQVSGPVANDGHGQEQQNRLSPCPEGLHTKGHEPPSSSQSISHTVSFSSSGPGPSTFDFVQARRREVQNAIAVRAAERRRRKRAKERGRELDALLQLKAGQLRAADAWALAAPPRRRVGDETVVLAASGSDRRHAHTNTILFDDIGGLDNIHRERQEMMQLVAKMIFRRRDSPRPLSGKSVSPTRSYIRSSLSRVVETTTEDYDDSRSAEEADMS